MEPRDKTGTLLQAGDYLKGVYGGYYKIVNDIDGVWRLYLVCEPGHPCEDIPYAFIPEIYEKVPPNEVIASPKVKYPTSRIIDTQTGEPVAHSITIGNLWVDTNSRAFYFTVANPGEVGPDNLEVLSYEQATTLRDFIDEQLKRTL